MGKFGDRTQQQAHVLYGINRWEMDKKLEMVANETALANIQKQVGASVSLQGWFEDKSPLGGLANLRNLSRAWDEKSQDVPFYGLIETFLGKKEGTIDAEFTNKFFGFSNELQKKLEDQTEPG